MRQGGDGRSVQRVAARDAPMWLNDSVAFTTSASLHSTSKPAAQVKEGVTHLDKSDSRAAQQIARAVVAFVYQNTNHAPGSAVVAHRDKGLAINLYRLVAPAAGGPARPGAAVVELYRMYRDLFTESSDWLRREISRITGLHVRAVDVHLDAAINAVVVLVDQRPTSG